jgi:hypothetical protein
MHRMFDWFFRIFDWSFPSRERRLQEDYGYKPSKTCKVCGRTYGDVDSAAICGDWDKVMGTNRHYWK